MALIAPHPKISVAWNARGSKKMACHALSWIFCFKPLKPMWAARDAESTKLLLPRGSVLFCFHSSCATALIWPSWKAGLPSPPWGVSFPESPAPQLPPNHDSDPRIEGPLFSTPQAGERFRFHTPFIQMRSLANWLFLYKSKYWLWMFENMAITQKSQSLSKAGVTNTGWQAQTLTTQNCEVWHPFPLLLDYLGAHALIFLSLCSLTCKMRIQIAPVP